MAFSLGKINKPEESFDGEYLQDMKYKIYQWLHRQIAKSRFLVKVAISLKYHCKDIIQEYLGQDFSVVGKSGEELLISAVAPQITTFFDVGANEGRWTELLLKYSKREVVGYLYEPMPSLAQELRRKFFGYNLVINNCAVSDNSGEAMFYCAGSASSLVEKKCPESILVSKTTLDIEVQRNKLEYVDFIKIDTEGYDWHVLRGANGLLHQKKAGIVQFEFMWAWKNAGSTLKQAMKYSEGLGYKIYFLRKDGLYNYPYEILGEDIRGGNFVAISPKWDWVANKLHKGTL